MTLALYVGAFLATVAVVALGSTWLFRRISKGAPWPAGAEEAIRLVWCTAFEQDWSKRPRVFFIRGKDLNGTNGKSWIDLFGRQVAGQTMTDPWACNIAYPEGTRWADTALAHELGHAYDHLVGRPEDPEHKGSTFAAGGRVERADSLLESWESKGAA